MVAIAKIGGIVDVSNESVTDNSINLTASLGLVLRDSLSRDLDLGLLNGARAARAGRRDRRRHREATGANLLAAAPRPGASIADAGGTAHAPSPPSGRPLADADTDGDAKGQLVLPARVRRRARPDRGARARAGHAAGLRHRPGAT